MWIGATWQQGKHSKVQEIFFSPSSQPLGLMYNKVEIMRDNSKVTESATDNNKVAESMIDNNKVADKDTKKDQEIFLGPNNLLGLAKVEIMIDYNKIIDTEQITINKASSSSPEF
jgi:hypothetical protein